MLLVVNDGKLKERETREQRDRYNRLTFRVDVMNNMGKDWRKAELAFRDEDTSERCVSKTHNAVSRVPRSQSGEQRVGVWHCRCSRDYAWRPRIGPILVRLAQNK